VFDIARAASIFYQQQPRTLQHCATKFEEQGGRTRASCSNKARPALHHSDTRISSAESPRGQDTFAEVSSSNVSCRPDRYSVSLFRFTSPRRPHDFTNRPLHIPDSPQNLHLLHLRVGSRLTPKPPVTADIHLPI